MRSFITSTVVAALTVLALGAFDGADHSAATAPSADPYWCC
ncbi:hypothetical protein [Nocardioides conyzicola]